MLKAFLKCLVLGSLLQLSTADSNTVYAADQVYHAQGEFAGEPTTDSVLLQTRLTAIPGPDVDENHDIPGKAGVGCFEWSESEDFSSSQRTAWQEAIADRDFIIRAQLTDLKPGTKYFYRAVIGEKKQDARPQRTCSFETLPGEAATVPLSFAMGSCQNYAFFMFGKSKNHEPAPEADRKLGYPSYAAMTELDPAFFIGTGDIVYYDHPASTAAKTLPELRRKWHEQFRFPRMVTFFSQTPAYWLKDDHDFRYNDADRGGDKKPSTSTGISMFREQMPIHPQGDETTPTYRTQRVHKHLQLWFLEGRDHRSPNRMEDGPGKTIWGKEQTAWLKQTLKESDATWKILISPTPMVGPDSGRKKDNHTNLGGFRHEAQSFFDWLNENNLDNVINFCGDRHWQYHSVHPSGMEEFSCGALNDENAISGVRPGNKNSTDPKGEIDQRFLYPEATGGFLFVQVGDDNSDRLHIEFHDDTGKLLHEVTKSPKRD